MSLLSIFSFFLLAVNCVLAGQSSGEDCLNSVFQWKDLEYEFPNDIVKSHALKNELYVPGNGVPIDVDAYYKRDGSVKVFTTIPRFTTGIPFSLATVSRTKTGPGGPILKPYPSFSWHASQGGDCDGITSVFRIKIDACKQLWVLDTGKIGAIQHCQPQLLVFNLKNDELLHRYRFPESQYKNTSLFITPVVDIRDPPPSGYCKNARVYIADVTGFGIVVYDSISDSSWRIENKLTEYQPAYENFTIAGESFTLGDGVFGMAVTPPGKIIKSYYGPNKRSTDRKLFFHALASVTENAVSLDLIDNKSIWEQNPNESPESFTTIGSRNIQSASQAMDSQGNLFFGLMNPVSIASWNINTPYDTFKIRLVNNQTLQFASGMKIIRNSMMQEELWVNTCRFQKIMAGTMDRKNDVNFRIQGGLVKDILKK